MFSQLIRHNHQQAQTKKNITSKKIQICDYQTCALDQENQQNIFWNTIFPNFNFLKELAASNCSLVWLVKDLRNQDVCVAKIIQKIQNQGSKKNHQNCQIQFLKNNQLNLGVKIIQIQETEDFYLIQMENCCGGSLEYYINYFTLSSRRYSTQHLNWVKGCMIKIIEGLQQIHSLNYVHRDLKPSNILVSHQGNLKISDFGFIYKQYQQDSSFCGTPHYMPPQVLENKSKNKFISKAIDIWALGIIFFQLLTGNVPFDGDDSKQILELIYSGFLQTQNQMPESAKRLIKSLLQINPKNRIKLNKLKENQFFKQQF